MAKKGTKQQWNISEDGKSLFNNLAGESERAQVIIASTFLENGLEACLRLKFKNEKAGNGLINKLFGGVLQHFAAKISIARAIGIINQATYEAFLSILKIRNSFAHDNFKIKLSSPKLKSEINNLKNYLRRECKECMNSAWEKEVTERLNKFNVLVSNPSDLYFLFSTVNLFGYLGITEFHLKESV